MLARRKTPRRTTYHALRSKKISNRYPWHVARGSVLIGIGIDLLSLDRAHDLLKRHGRSFFVRILSPQEKQKKLVVSAIQLARYFTAKEAFFKATNLAWTDLNGFTGMWIESIHGSNFKMGCFDSKLKGYGQFFKKGDIWGAKVQTWKI